MSNIRPRIALVHALRESVEPARLAFAAHWSEAETFSVLDDSLSAAVELQGSLTPAVAQRFVTLARYAATPGPDGRDVHGMLITSSAFVDAIVAVKSALSIPVMGPYEAAFQSAIDQVAVEKAHRIGLLVTFKPSERALTAELHRFARMQGKEVAVTSLHVPGALECLQAGNVAGHNALIAAAAELLRDRQLIIFGQFSMATALQEMPPDLAARVLTTPVCAVTGMRRAVGSVVQGTACS